MISITPLLNTLYAVKHWRRHATEDGWVDAVFDPTVHKHEVAWGVITWCPVCTITAMYKWLVNKLRRLARS